MSNLVSETAVVGKHLSVSHILLHRKSHLFSVDEEQQMSTNNDLSPGCTRSNTRVRADGAHFEGGAEGGGRARVETHTYNDNNRHDDDRGNSNIRFNVAGRQGRTVESDPDNR